MSRGSSSLGSGASLLFELDLGVERIPVNRPSTARELPGEAAVHVAKLADNESAAPIIDREHGHAEGIEAKLRIGVLPARVVADPFIDQANMTILEVEPRCESHSRIHLVQRQLPLGP